MFSLFPFLFVMDWLLCVTFTAHFTPQCCAVKTFYSVIFFVFRFVYIFLMIETFSEYLILIAAQWIKICTYTETKRYPLLLNKKNNLAVYSKYILLHIHIYMFNECILTECIENGMVVYFFCMESKWNFVSTFSYIQIYIIYFILYCIVLYYTPKHLNMKAG